MQLEHIKIFAAVADCGSMSEAARELFISHSTVSRAVSALESEMNVRLVERSSNKVMKMTPAGELFAAEGKKLLEEVDKLIADVKNKG